MKQKIIDALKAKFEGVSDNIIERVANRLTKTVNTDEEVAAAVEGVTFQQVLESYGDARATDATKTAVANYERKHGLKDGVKAAGGEPKTEPNTEPKQDDTMPEWARVLVESNKRLTERIAAIDTERTATDRRGKLDALLKDLPEQLRRPYRRYNLSEMSDEEFGKMLEELPDEIAEQQQLTAASQAVFGRPAAQAKQPASTEASDAEIEALAKKLNI